MTDSVLTTARKTASTLIREGHQAGWKRVRCEIKPDGRILYEAAMSDSDNGDDFLNEDLKM